MADLPVQPVQNFGQLLSSYSEGLSNAENASTNRLNAQANLSQVPSEIAARNAGIGQTQANTSLVGNEATGKDIENQKAALMLQLTKNALHNYAESSDAAAAPKPGADRATRSDTPEVQAPAADTDDDTADTDAGPSAPVAAAPKKPDDPRFKSDDDSAAHFDQVASDKFRVNPAFTPQEQAQFSAAIPLAIGGEHGMLDAVKTQHEQRVQTQLANSQNQAQQAADKMYAINTAPKSTAFMALKGAYPAAADSLAKIHGLDPDHPEKWTAAQQAEMDDSARKRAGMIHDSVFQYTGDKLEDKNGQNRNSRTGQIPIGGQAQGVSPAKYAEVVNDARSLVTLPDPKGGPDIHIAKWRASGMNEAAFIRSQLSGGPTDVTNGGSTVGGKSQPVAGSGVGTTAVSPTPGQAPPTVGNLTQDPTLRKALADPDFKLQQEAPSDAANGFHGMSKQGEATLASRTALLKDGEDATNAAQLSNQYMTAAQQILDSKQIPTTGPFGSLMAKASALLPGQHVDASNYQELAKYLGNAGLAQAKGIYGSRMTQSEVGLQLNELSPSVHMTDKAVRNLLAGNIRSAQYTIDSASRSKSYLASGGDPQNFEKWQAKYFDRGKLVNPPGVEGSEPTTPGVTAAPKALPTGAKFTEYAKTHFGGDTAKAKAFLTSQGYQ